MNIVIIGFGELGQELLISGLQNNIFHPNQHIEYHIFGSDDGFFNIHREVASISDPVIFHSEPWYQQQQLLEFAQAVIVVQQKNQLKLLQDLQLAIKRTAIHVFAASPSGVHILANNTLEKEQDQLIIFDWKAESLKLENILGTKLFERAKQINLHYIHKLTNLEENNENKEKEWARLDTFDRYSNISTADFYEVQCKILECNHLPADINQIPPEWLEYLAELEHMRWCRYHYINNWKYGTPENGARKNKEHRIHSLLLPYHSLSEENKQKNRENIRVLFGIKYSEQLK